jgi:Lrp/AsnC family transcriptional regulator, regulator for asnA, asnC and gidA
MKHSLLDRQIIECLNQDARMPSSRIAHLTGKPERTVRQRINKMVSSGVIKPVVVVDPAAFDYNMVVDIFCQVDPANIDQVLSSLSLIPEISYIAFSTGDQDIVLQARFTSSAEMNAFITHRLYQIPGMKRTHTVLVLSVIKESYQWLPPPEAFES